MNTTRRALIWLGSGCAAGMARETAVRLHVGNYGLQALPVDEALARIGEIGTTARNCV